jgi:protocatechuate 3,4-dioxygenase beta subunit
MSSASEDQSSGSALTDEVIASFQATPDPRLRAVTISLVRHLHDFIRDVQPSLAEWQTAIDYLTAVGHMCTDVRQEFVLLSDVLGASMLVETINDQKVPGATDSTVLGPFHMTESPPRQLGDTIDLIGVDPPAVVVGSVRSSDGIALPGAAIDVWQCDSEGFYDVQQPHRQPAGNGRGLFTADASGRFWFRTVVPSHYPIPTDGPVGKLLAATDRHPYRPAHIHFIASAPGHKPLTTHLFMPESPYLTSDAVFAVKQSLVAELSVVDDDQSAQLGVPAGSTLITGDLVLAPDPLAPRTCRGVRSPRAGQ